MARLSIWLSLAVVGVVINKAVGVAQAVIELELVLVSPLGRITP
jgi:hypothetical protein